MGGGLEGAVLSIYVAPLSTCPAKPGSMLLYRTVYLYVTLPDLRHAVPDMFQHMLVRDLPYFELF